METLSFHELKKQTSSFLKEKVRAARLAFTDTTTAELLTEELTSGDRWPPPESRTMGAISRAAYDIDDYWRVARVLHKRLARFNRKEWKESYHALILLEHLLTHGPKSFSEEFQVDKEVIKQAGRFHFVDDRGFDWGQAIRMRSERTLKLLEEGPLLGQERDRARELTRRISRNSSSVSDHREEDSAAERSRKDFGRRPTPMEDGHSERGLVPEMKPETKPDHPFISFREDNTDESLLSGGHEVNKC